MRAQACPGRRQRWEVHGAQWVRAAHHPSAVSCCGEYWGDGGDVLEVKYAAVAGLAEADIGEGSNPVARDEQVRRFLLPARMGSNVVP